jgi:hypothetical protein
VRVLLVGGGCVGFSDDGYVLAVFVCLGVGRGSHGASGVFLLFLSAESKMAAMVDEPFFFELLDKGGAGRFPGLTDHDTPSRCDAFHFSLRQTGQEILRCHVGEVSIGTDGIAGNPTRAGVWRSALREGLREF